MTTDLISNEALELLGIYQDAGALEEFLLDMVVSSEEDPYLFPDHQRVALDLMWRYSHLWMLMTRRAGKTFLIGNGVLGMACLLSAADASIKVGIYSGSFAQAKLDFFEIMKTWRKSPFIQSITEKPPRVLQDRCELILKGHGRYEGVTVEARPLNSQKGAETSRGFGFQILVVDEFQILPRSTYAAIFPTASASGNPMKRVIEAQRARVSGGVRSVERFRPEKNRLILAGNAGYTFYPAYDTYQEFVNNAEINRLAKKIVPMFGKKVSKETRSDLSKLLSLLPAEELKEQGLPSFETGYDLKDKRSNKLQGLRSYLVGNWTSDKDYVYKLPYAALPREWHDRSMISMQQSIFTEAELDIEYNCNWRSDTTGPFRASALDHATVESIMAETRGELGYNYFLGVDPGHMHSKFAVAVVKQLSETQCVLVNMHIIDGIPIQEQVRVIFGLVNAFWPVGVLTIDAGAGGAGRPLAGILGERSDNHGVWGRLGPLTEMHPTEDDDLSDDFMMTKNVYKIINLWNMTVNNVAQVNDRLLADIQSSRFLFAGSVQNVEDEMALDGVRQVKKTMTRLVRKIRANSIGYDLTGHEGKSDHHHDDWSALTCALAGYYLYQKPKEDVNMTNFFKQGGWITY